MSKKSTRIVFLGTESFSLPALKVLVEESWPVLVVITRPDTHRGRGQKLSAPAIKDLAEASGIKVLQPLKVGGLEEKIAALAPTHGVLVAYGAILPQSFIDLFPGGIINVHPSLLPLYRGPSPVENAILDGVPLTGVSLMQLSAKMDAGPVYTQTKLELDGTEDRLGLTDKLAKLGAELLADNLDKIVLGQMHPVPQDETQATYTKLLKKEDGLIDWAKPVAALEREIRAFRAFPKSRAELFGHQVTITKVRIADSQTDGELVKACGQGHLEILELVAPSGRLISGADFLRGYKT